MTFFLFFVDQTATYSEFNAIARSIQQLAVSQILVKSLQLS